MQGNRKNVRQKCNKTGKRWGKKQEQIRKTNARKQNECESGPHTRK